MKVRISDNPDIFSEHTCETIVVSLHDSYQGHDRPSNIRCP